MDEMFCNQANAYPVTGARQSELEAVRVYEQLKAVIESTQSTLSDDQQLVVISSDPATGVLVVDHIGYLGQTFLVLSGRDAEDTPSIALLPAASAHLVLKIIARTRDETTQPIQFMGHTIKPQG